MHICLKSFCLFHRYLPFTDEFPSQDILNDFNLPALLLGKYISFYWHLFGLNLSLALIALLREGAGTVHSFKAAYDEYSSR